MLSTDLQQGQLGVAGWAERNPSAACPLRWSVFPGQGPSLTSEAGAPPLKGAPTDEQTPYPQPEFKARVAMEAISGRKTIQEIAADHGIHPIQVSQWKKQLLEGASELFSRGKKSQAKDESGQEAELFQQIGRLQMWTGVASKKNLSCSDARELRKLVDHGHPELSVSRQCALLGLPRSTLYYRPTPVRESTLRIMARIDALYLEDPCSGSRRMVHYLGEEGIPISDRVRNLMRRMGLRAIPEASNHGAWTAIEKSACLVDPTNNHRSRSVWATDITYIPLQKGFLYLVAIMDLHSRHVLSWKLSNSLDAGFCLDALEMALAGGRKPESSAPTKAASSPPSTLWRSCRSRRSRSAGQGESAATTTSWWRGCGGRSSMRRCTCAPTAMAGRLKSAWPASSGGTAM